MLALLYATSLASAIAIVGRVGLASLFVLGGISKLLTYEATSERMATVGLPLVSVLLPSVIALELTAGIMVAAGSRYLSVAAILLAGFTLSTNPVFHDFWNVTGQRSALELSLFFKNLSIAGALLYVAAVPVLRGDDA
ncbi:MAG: DoxX family protein [Pseudomonadota bacterium]